ncbi:uncharacterized protein [Prorops nasuta]|uniref:uncharacterized protein n=1 Tax=Prorops nasuta TaxID=863751 RepID=UPI0034CDFEA2
MLLIRDSGNIGSHYNQQAGCYIAESERDARSYLRHSAGNLKIHQGFDSLMLSAEGDGRRTERNEREPEGKSMRGCYGFLAIIAMVYLHFCRADCPAETGQPLDLNEFSGKWFMVAGTPVSGKAVSNCGQFLVTKTSEDSFTMKYSAISHRGNRPVTFNVNATINNNNVVANWKLEGSKKVLGPFKHITVSKDYSSYLAMVVCSKNDSSHDSGYKFSMIWSREKSLSSRILEELKTALTSYVHKANILLVDHESC